MIRFFFGFLIFYTLSFAVSEFKSQPEILFDYSKIKSSYETTNAQSQFNKGVVLLGQKKYIQAIEIFKQTAKYYQLPSYLNIGISYFKMNSISNAKLYFEKIYTTKDAQFSDIYVFLSSCYYLYKITKDDTYLEKLAKAARVAKKLDQQSLLLLVDAYISLGEYKSAVDILSQDPNADNFKMAILYLKMNNYQKAGLYLKKAQSTTHQKKMKDKLYWVNIYYDLKTNNIIKLGEDLKYIDANKRGFTAHVENPIRLIFNKKKYSTSEYFEKINNFDFDRQVDFLFYFSPFILSDNEEIFYDSAQGYINSKQNNLQALDKMLNYNANLLKVIKKDPIERVFVLQQLAKTDTKSYIYYNLGLSYAQIDDFQKAHFYFKKAFRLKPGNKIYAALTLISAKKINLVLKETQYIIGILQSPVGLYNYYGQQLYKFFIDPKFLITSKPDDAKYKSTIYARALEFMVNLHKQGVDKNSPLLVYHKKDPLVYLLSLIAKDKKESDFAYITRLQDNTPLKLNNNFLAGPLVISKYYFDILKATALFARADLNIVNNSDPSYLRTRAYRQLHFDNPQDALKIIEYLQKKYQIGDIYTSNLLTAAYLASGRYEDAILNISYLQSSTDDVGANFLTGILLISELKTAGVIQYFKAPYKDPLIDFEIKNIDSLLNSM